MKYFGSAIILVAIGSLITGFLFGSLYGCLSQTVTTPLPSLMQIQERIGVEPDGIPGPVTMEAWDLAYNQQCADKSFEGKE